MVEHRALVDAKPTRHLQIRPRRRPETVGVPGVAGSDPRALRIGDRISKSHDGGRTWSTPRRVNTEPTTQAFTPSTEVAPNGTLGITHYDLRFNTDDGGATRPTDYWFLHSHDDGAAWSESRITGDSFDMRDAPFARGLFTGDYEGLAVQDGNFLTLFSQPHGTTRPTPISHPSPHDR
jgi:hypothetical protein